MILHKSSKYVRNVKSLRKKKHTKIVEKVEMMEQLLINHDNLHELRKSKFYEIYRFEKLKGDRKEEFSCRLDQQWRLIFKPLNEDDCGFEDIVEITLEEVSNHYK